MTHTYGIRRGAISLAIGCSLLLGSLFARTGPAKKQGLIAFVSNASGSFQLYTIERDGSNLTQITNLAPTSYESWYPTISPDGQRVLFAYGQGFTSTDLFVVNIDGGGLTQITNDGLAESPRWSPDGNYIVYAHVSTNDYLNSAFYLPHVITVIRADGTGTPTRLTNAIWDSYAPFYSPDGETVFYYSQDGGFVARVWSTEADGEDKRVFTAPALRGGPYSISPDGRRVTVIGNTNISTAFYSNDLYLLDVATGNLTQLTHFVGLHHDLYPSYSPDGSEIVFASDRLSLNNYDLFVMNADGSNIRRIATGLTVGGCPDGNCVTPFWGP